MRKRKFIRNLIPGSWICLILLLALIPSICAADFTAKQVADYGNITVMEVSGNYDARNADGSNNDLARQVIAKEFFKTHKDEYDFVVIFTNFDFNMPNTDAKAFYTAIINDIKGIGREQFDNSQLYGSNKKLQGTIDVGNITKLVLDPLDPKFEDTLYLFGHEHLHRWGAYVKFKDKDGNIRAALLGIDNSHWSYLLDTSASVMYGNKWQDNGDGTFTSVQASKYLSPLDLYLMGFIDKSQVPPMLLIENPEVAAEQMPEAGKTIPGTAKYVTIDDIIAAEGERIPAAKDSPTSFKAAFILISAPGAFTSEQLSGLEKLRNEWITRFSILTDGKGIISVTPTLLPDIPVNPGVPVIPGTPRTLPPSLDAGVKWLMGAQQYDGNWMDIQQTTVRDTAEVVNIIGKFDISQKNYASGLQWLNNAAPGNTDYLARKIITFANAGQDSSSLAVELIALQNSDGGWGSAGGYTSNAVDTALALRALAIAGNTNQDAISKAVNYLKTRQNSDGGWGAGDGVSIIEVTANALSALNKYRNNYQLTDSITKGLTYLSSRQNADGSFGSGSGAIYETAIAVLALNELDGSAEGRSKAITYILGQQSENGSWKQSPYQTALAVKAVYRATVDPDLSVKADDIELIPATISSIPTNITAQVKVANLGRTGAPQAKVAIYDGAVAAANKIAEQNAAFPGQASVTLTFQIPVTDGKEHVLYVVADPDNLIQESNKANNTAIKIISQQGTYDFEVLFSDLSVSPAAVDLYQDVKITSKIRNNGTMTAYNVHVKYYIDDPQGAYDISTAAIDIPAGATVTKEVTWNANKSGENMAVTVQVDPLNAFTEISKANNKAATSLTVRGSTDANLAITYQDIAVNPNPLNERGNATITATVKNTGFAQASNIKVNFFKGAPGVDGVLLGSGTIDSINAGESKQAVFNWTNIADSGERLIYVQVDPDNQIKEISKEDNKAFVTVNILSLPDLAISANSITFSPSAPKDGDKVGITVTVQNKGQQPVSNVSVRASESNNIIGTQVIAAISGNAQGAATFIYDTAGKKGPHQINVVVDPDNQIVEQSEDNNSASRTIGVQDANLWVTEPYFSPNGDGVKDSTQFFFRLATPQTVKIVVTNKKNKAVRTFSTGDLTNTSGGNVTWDGLNDDGMVVQDGQYHINVIDAGSNSLGSQLVIVDNNRSPITDAVGTKYLLNANLTCELNDMPNWQWLPDDSGIIFGITYASDTDKYPKGIYFESGDGSDIIQIVPDMIGDTYHVSLGAYPSPNGREVAFISERYEQQPSTYYYTTYYGLWLAQVDGSQRRMLLELDENTGLSYDLKWSPDGRYIAYVTRSHLQNEWTMELTILDVETLATLKVNALTGSSVNIDSIMWKPDSKGIMFITSEYDCSGSNCRWIYEIKVADMAGNIKTVYSNSDADNVTASAEVLSWFGNNLLASINDYQNGRSNLKLIDGSGSGNHKTISGSFDAVYHDRYAMSPDGKYFAFMDLVDYSDGKKVGYVKISDADGNIRTIHSRIYKVGNYGNFGYGDCYSAYYLATNMMWSPDRNKLTFVEGVYTDGYACTDVFGPDLVVMNLKTGAALSFAFPKYFPRSDRFVFNRWLSDDNTIIAKEIYYLDYYEHRRLSWIDTENGEIKELLNVAYFTDTDQQMISPFEHHIAYYKYQEDSNLGACNNKGLDLWAMSSLLNLTANLQIKKEKSSVILKGTAADLNFEGYKLEYADIKTPQQWNPVAPPSDTPVFNDLFTTWVPPADGVYYVQLTVWDKAGNRAVNRKRVSWGITSSITNLYKNYDIFSPNGDGVKDTVTLNYTALEPVHLEFNIYDENSKLIRTYRKDHSGFATDSIVWDGRDENGNLVSDGKYIIKVFDYQFFVEVDNKPPEVQAVFSKLKHGGFSAELVGHIYDTNLKSWVMEYGAGDNPQEWQKKMEGSDVVVGKDDKGDLILNPIKDTTIFKEYDESLKWLVDSKLRITAEDAAGNKTTVITGFLEEQLLLYQWDSTLLLLNRGADDRFIAVESLAAHQVAAAGLVRLGGLSTLRAQLVKMNVQYSDKGQWIDSAPVTEGYTGKLNIDWSNPGLQQGALVRIKAVDIAGNEYYSNVIGSTERFDISCLGSATNSVYEEIRSLAFEVQSVDDSRYSQITVYKAYDANKGDIIPVGVFRAPQPDVRDGMKYDIRMSATGISGRQYTSGWVQYPVTIENCSAPDPGPGSQFKLSIAYGEAECNTLSDGKVALSAGISGYDKVELQTIDYYLQKPEGSQLLRRFDIAKEGFGSVTVDTLTLPEGNYPAKAVLTYLDMQTNSVKQLSDQNTLIVDRVPPTSRITYPAKSMTVCPVTISAEKKDWYGIPVEGEASDNTALRKYALFYGPGDSPAAWQSAMTRLGKEKSPIQGQGARKGKLDTWDITDLKGDQYSLRLKVVDTVGNTTCTDTNFMIDRVVEIVEFSTDKKLFSPNGDDVMDELVINYTINKYAMVDVKVFKLLEQNEEYVPDTTSLRTITSGLQHLDGSETVKWDGKGDSGQVLPDGLYAIKVFAKDSCGNINSRWTGVEIDNTPPLTVISYPRPPDQLGNIVEVKGSADDLHFKNYLLEAGAGENPETWKTISAVTSPVNEGILAEWNTSELSGKWTLRLTTFDTAGNKSSITSLVDLGQRKALITNLAANPQLFSPNNDGKLDTTSISYALSDACQVKIDIVDSSSAIKKTYTNSAPAAGTYSYAWAGKDNSEAVVPDGAYAVKLSVALTSNPSVTQEEAITVMVDSTLPVIDIKHPAANSYLSSNDVQVFGTISDLNLTSYALLYTGAGGAVQVDTGSQNREGHVFGTLNGLAEGSYTLNVTASDKAGNAAERNIAFTIDRTAPKVTMESPKDGELYGLSKGSINITGSIVETNLDTYSVRYGAGENPTQWIELAVGNTIPASAQLFSWKVGKNDGIPDGVYTLSLYAKDKAGLTGEARAKITIDNMAPEVSITAPKDNEYVTKAVDIKGTAYDLNIDKYTLELSEGNCASAYKWGVMKTASASVRDGVLYSWQTLPADGDYCCKLTAVDKSGSKSETKVNVKVDTHPPAVPSLTGKLEDKTTARLDWNRNVETDLAGYNLYRNSQKINTALISDITYPDQNLKEGSYAFTVTAVDLAGNESKPSNEVRLNIDLSGPEARLKAPQNGTKVSSLVDIKGTAYSSDDFKQYRVYIGQGSAPASWTLIRTSPVPVTYGTLAQWDTIGLSEGQFSIKLETEDIIGNKGSDQVTVTIDNTPPATPVLISATPNASDVTLVWGANTETDLAGYLVYRNDQLVNASGIVIGDLKPYLIKGTTYLNQAVPDGKHKYYIVAVDQAGNQSNQSNVLEVDIDTHAPRATIVVPTDKDKIQDKTLVRAESSDIDISSVQFQYKKSTDSVWVNLGTPVTLTSYITYFDPKTLQLVYADYQLRAVATDKNSKTDATPPYITVTYTDLTPADAPKELKALTNGQDVSLSWKANPETDVSGYNVYRTSEGVKTKITTSLVTGAAYEDKGLADGPYAYEVTAMDSYGNESKPSNSATVKIYAPKLDQPYTPMGQNNIAVSGSGAEANVTVEVFDEVNSAVSSVGTGTADSEGKFSFAQVSLASGENRLTVKAKDSSGNISRASEMALVVYNEAPSAPTGLVSAVNDHTVQLSWNPNSETDLSGYNVYRNDVKLNKASVVETGTADASSYNYYLAANAFDGNTSTFWISGNNYQEEFRPEWWELKLEVPELISRMEIQWHSNPDGAGNETLYAGKDFEIQVWSGYAWITQKKVSGNTEKENVFDFSPSYRTDRIRVYITDTTDPGSYARYVGITEVRVTKDNLVTDAAFTESDVKDGSYSYKVTAVDYYGFESQPSDETKTVVGDIIPPSPPQNLKATASGSSILLGWDRNSEADVAGYNVYRNTAQGWLKINPATVADNAYTDPNLINGLYTYRVTAVDAAGNESLPSNEAAAQVGIEPPQPPINLTVTVVPGGGALNIAWEHPGAPAGYNLYRSATRGGPYTRINSAVLTSSSYADSGLANGVAYYYVSVAIDTFGNESAYSNEGSGVPNDSAAPGIPMLFYPTISGRSITLYQDTTDVAGKAEAGSKVELFRNGFSAGKTDALKESKTLSFATEQDINWAALSPDAATLAYIKDNTLWLKYLASGDTIEVAKKADYPFAWAPDGTRLAYVTYDSNWLRKLNIYHVKKKTSASLTADQNANESSPSWTYDGSRLAFISDRDGEAAVWIKDMTSDTTPVKVGSGYNPYAAKISPDGRRVAYADLTSSLYAIDSSGGNAILIDSNSDSYTLGWSADGGRLINLSKRTGNYNIFVYEFDSAKTTQITSLTKDVNYAAWSPDGTQIAWSAYIDNSNLSVQVSQADSSGTPVVLKQNAGNVVYLGWAPTGGIAYLSNSKLTVHYPAGVFSFSGVQLDVGETLFYAVAGDFSGNTSAPSSEISVVYNSDKEPDIAVSADGLTVFPGAPITGQKVNITASVTNKGQEDQKNVEATLYLMDDKGVMTLLKSETISSIAAGTDATITAELDTTGKTGVYQIIINADPNNLIDESDETNNRAVKEFVVMAQEGVKITTTLDATAYKSNQDMSIRIDLANSGVDRTGVVETLIENSNGQKIATVDTRAIQLPYSAHQYYKLVWNTGSTYTGNYRAHAIFKDASGALISESTAPFVISPDTAVEVAFATDKVSYGSNENVVMEATIKSAAKNYIISGITAKVNVTDATGNVLFTEVKAISSLLPGGSAALGYQWNTALNLSGAYRASVEVYVGDKPAVSKTAAFSINPTMILTGSVRINPAVISLGGAGTVDYAVQNGGNESVTGLPLRIMVVDPDSQAASVVHETIVDLAGKEGKAGSFALQTGAYALKTYAVIFQYILQGSGKTIASAAFSVRDGSAPAVNIISPVTGSAYNGTVNLAVTATDNAIGVEKVEYRIDNGEWKLLPLADPATSRFGISWTPGKSDEGSRIISFRAIDKAGNTSGPVSTAIVIDLTAPQAPQIISPPDNSTVLTSTVDIKGVAEPGSVVKMEGAGSGSVVADAASGAFTFSGVTLASTVNSFTFTAADSVGNISGPGTHTLTLNIRRLSLKIATDKAAYGLNNVVNITSNVQNVGEAIEGLIARITVVNSSGQILFTENKAVGTLAANQVVEIKSSWNTALNPKGTYTVKLEVMQNSSLLNTASAGFTILGSSETGDGISGTIGAQPISIFQGEDVSFTYTVKNQGNEDIGGLSVKVVVVNPDTNETIRTFENTVSLPLNITASGNFTFTAEQLAPGQYKAVLKAATATMSQTVDLGEVVFDVKAALEITKKVTTPISLLVWINDDCNRHHKKVGISLQSKVEGQEVTCEPEKKCVKEELFKKIFAEVGISYYIVYDKKEFQQELRNPAYSDIFVIGDRIPLKGHYAEELREQVFGGRGLISSMYLKHGKLSDYGDLFGFKYSGHLNEKSHTIKLIKSPISEVGIMETTGEALSVIADDTNNVVAWFEERHKKRSKECEPQKQPAILLNSYGSGKAVYYAVDLGLTLNEQNYEQVSELIKNSITYVHKTADSAVFAPNQLALIELTIKSLGSAFDLRVTETYPADIRIYDMLGGKLITDNPWIWNDHIEAGGMMTRQYYAYTPDKAGVYTLDSEVAYKEGSNYVVYKNMPIDLRVEKDTKAICGDIITDLTALSVGKNDRSRIKVAIREITEVRNRSVKSAHDVEKNIKDILEAIEAVSSVTSANVSRIRLKMDRLLESCEADWYTRSL
jgi:Tol biopolymer transport system component/flagellar hook assembly protein FlgD